MTLVGGISTVIIKTADEFIGRGSTVLVKFAGGRPVEPTTAGPGVQLPVAGRPRQLAGGSSTRPKTPDSGRYASSDEEMVKAPACPCGDVGMACAMA